MDHVEKILNQWHQERPDLDVAPMGLLGRLLRLFLHLSREMEKTFAEYDLTPSSFDVLATLRRSGPDYRLSPGELSTSTMVSSGTMTNRIDQLERAGLVERVPNPKDGRSFIIGLTDSGFQLIDGAVTAHVATQARLTSVLEESEKTALNALLEKYLSHFEE
jgi:DNA-binding MarR family transcriptional regulator